MYLADLEHPSPVLQEKLTRLYNLRPGKDIDLGFRPDYLQLLEAYGSPHEGLPPVFHVAGTNGKGSMIATLRALLEAAGKSVSAFTSPHLLQFNERLYASGGYISNDALSAAIDKALALNAGRQVSFFEITTAMAMDFFRQANTDYCLLEVGMGGRLDCTNIIEAPAACLIGNISYDHQQFLGETITDIAGEKAGIIKPGVPCVVGPQTEDVMDVFVAKAAAIGAPIYIHGRDWHVQESKGGMRLVIGDESFDFPSPSLLGAHQIGNAATALTALYVTKNWNVQAYACGLANIHWPGRLQRLQDGETEIWYDGGCNESAAHFLAQQLDDWQETSPSDLHLIIGMKGDKDPSKFITPLLQHAKSATIVPIDKISKTLQLEDVQHIAFPFTAQPSVDAALGALPAGPKRVLITGSLYLAGQILDRTLLQLKAA